MKPWIDACCKEFADQSAALEEKAKVTCDVVQSHRLIAFT